MKKAGAVIVAAGLSSRMGDFKPLLPFRRSTIIEEIINTFDSCGISPITVVTGYRAGELSEKLGGRNVDFVINDDYMSTDMLHSAKLGLAYILDRAEAAFFTPVDAPLFNARLLLSLHDEMERANADIVLPFHNGKGGHPVLIAVSAIEWLISYSGSGGLRAAINAYPGPKSAVHTPDIGILLDADFPEDYKLITLLDKALDEKNFRAVSEGIDVNEEGKRTALTEADPKDNRRD